ncbi:MAG: Rne/Rng family ribonuclease [Phycisphaerales bacterium]|nr:Rne/Rng family ribonuclease [Phycisphaerales bacterium]
MNKELIVNTSVGLIEIALLEDKKLVELHREKNDHAFSVGDIYVGKVKKIMQGINAAFVELGYERQAFLHYTDLSPHIRSLIKYTDLAIQSSEPDGYPLENVEQQEHISKSGKINNVLGTKPNVLVQILKEPIASKGPRLTCEISLPGRFVVLTPFNDVIAVSKKIVLQEERQRLFNIVNAIKPKNFGVIIRTAADNKSTADIHTDIIDLLAIWKNIQRNLKGISVPACIHTEQTKTNTILRDLLNYEFNKIVVNDRDMFRDMKDYIKKIAPEKLSILSLYSGSVPLFDELGITRQIKNSFGTNVSLPSGAYLCIEHTEALHVIDVNSGPLSISNSQEDTALKTNIEAAIEIARQLRLRDIGGIIVIDFVDMKLPQSRKQVYNAMSDFMKLDRARHTILPLSKFGLMQITRQRMKPELKINTSEACITCGGTGRVSSVYNLDSDIRNKIKILKGQGRRKLVLQVNPIVYAYLKKGWLFQSIGSKWQKEFKLQLKIIENHALGLIEYIFLDEHDEKIKF